jgi:ATP-dependent DNA helicase RecG
MNSKKTVEILRSGESQTVEFKTSFNDEVIISLNAFANSKGGKVLVGVADNGSPIAGFHIGKETIANCFKVTLFPVISEAIEATVSTTVNATVNATVLALLQLLNHQGAQSSADIRKALGFKNRSFVHKSYLQPALEVGYIKMTIPDKPNSRLQKYQLTQKGLTMVSIQGNKQKHHSR